MNCSIARQQLLASARPDEPGTKVDAHIARCPQCATVQRRLLRIEGDIPRLTIPACAMPEALFDQILTTPIGDLVAPSTRLYPADTAREASRQKVALAVALAASLAVFALGWWAWPRQEPPGPSVVRLHYRDDLNARLRGVSKPSVMVERLTDFAQELVNEMPRADHDRLADLATQLEWLLKTDLPYHAGQVSDTERAQVLGKALDRLREFDSATGRLVPLRVRDEGASRSLGRIALAVRTAEQKLRRLT